MEYSCTVIRKTEHRVTFTDEEMQIVMIGLARLRAVQEMRGRTGRTFSDLASDRGTRAGKLHAELRNKMIGEG